MKVFLDTNVVPDSLLPERHFREESLKFLDELRRHSA